jgi:hypothetical protein
VPAGSGSGRRGGRGGGRGGGRRVFGLGRLPGESADEQARRRRRWFVVAISVGAAIIVIALCAGALSILDAVNGVRDRAGDARAAREQRDNGCLELERRLNRLTPPGATTGPAARATAIRDENAAVRIYLGDLKGQRTEDGWRQLLDSRTVYADALDRQAKSRTPAFYVAPRTGDAQTVADQVAEESPAPCAGPIRRLAAPDL